MAMKRARRSMRSLFIPLMKEVPQDAFLPGHQLMVRAGLIRKTESGVYMLLPLALRSLKKIEAIIEDEMNGIDGQRMHMPCISGAAQWRQSGRWDAYGQEIFKLHDRKKASFCLAPTCEEAITSLVGGDVSSYRSLPLRLYQINLKFRDEIRPRFGLLRCREFFMKDMYSFDESAEKSIESYEAVSTAYQRIFDRIGVPVHRVMADSGAIGGSLSHEYHISAECGEDGLLQCTKCGYAANSERAISMMPRSTTALSETFTITTAAANGTEPFSLSNAVLAVVPAGRTPNMFLLQRHLGLPCRLASQPELESIKGDVPDRIIADPAVCGDDPGDESPVAREHIMTALPGDNCPHCSPSAAPLTLSRGIEVGHVFHLGTTYSEKFSAKFKDATGRAEPFHMGCFGLGMSRILQAVIESTTQADSRGISWPLSIAPYQAIVLSNGAPGTDDIARQVYDQIEAQSETRGEVVLDDRDTIRLGAKFRQAELVGFPFMIVAGRDSAQGLLEVQEQGKPTQLVRIDEILLAMHKKNTPEARPSPSSPSINPSMATA